MYPLSSSALIHLSDCCCSNFPTIALYKTINSHAFVSTNIATWSRVSVNPEYSHHPHRSAQPAAGKRNVFKYFKYKANTVIIVSKLPNLITILDTAPIAALGLLRQHQERGNGCRLVIQAIKMELRWCWRVCAWEEWLPGVKYANKVTPFYTYSYPIRVLLEPSPGTTLQWLLEGKWSFRANCSFSITHERLYVLMYLKMGVLVGVLFIHVVKIKEWQSL